MTHKEGRDSFRYEAARAWRDYEGNGRHVTQAEIDGWTDSLGTRRPKRAPKWREAGYSIEQ